jgi:DNA-binding CsgD family transcriptional regulator
LNGFLAAGAQPWVARVNGELRASGATLRRVAENEQLTPSELRIATLVAEGRSNKEVAALLVLSPRTVEFHLGHAFRKLGVPNRTALARAISELG